MALTGKQLENAIRRAYEANPSGGWVFRIGYSNEEIEAMEERGWIELNASGRLFSVTMAGAKIAKGEGTALL